MLSRVLILLLLIPCLNNAQVFEFNPVQQIPVTVNNSGLTLAWVGGINAAQFSECDLNLDGLNDLVIFDKSSTRILTFIYDNGNYLYRPLFAKKFPLIRHWMLMRDFDNDGKQDIFCSAGNGISVYRNTSQTELSFELVNSLISSNYGGSLDINLFVSQTDIPSIEDMDGDGDLDILTFFILGTCVEYHKNLTVENNLAPEALKFKLESNNWGNFTESSTSNSINLNTDCGGGVIGSRHSGSTLLLIDADGNSTLDLLLGDVSYPEMLLLTNNGAPNGQITQQSSNFPAALPINVPVFPAAFKVDINKDGKKDLLISPNSDIEALTTTSSWLYIDQSASNVPNFQLNTRAFLQSQMIDLGKGLKPDFIKWNQTTNDLLLSNSEVLENGEIKNKILLCRQNTTSGISYECEQIQFENFYPFSLTNLSFSSADLNADGVEDLVAGDETGKLYLFYRNATNQLNYQPLLSNIDVGDFAKPVLYDLNKDGLIDIVCGAKSGYLTYFQNNGTSQNPSFSNTPNLSNLGNVETIEENFSNFGYSSPWFFEYNAQTWLVCGSESGKLFFYNQIENNLNGTFSLVDSLALPYLTGNHTHPIAFIDSLNRINLFIGNQAGGLTHWIDDETLSIYNKTKTQNISIFPNPVYNVLNISTNSLNPIQSISIYDLLGKQIKYEINTYSFIDVSNLIPGIYILKVNTLGASYTKKFIKY